MRARLALREAGDVARRELPLACRRAQRRPARDDDEPLLVRVVVVVRPGALARRHFVERAADQLRAEVVPHPGPAVHEGPDVLSVSGLALEQVEDSDAHFSRSK